MQNELHTLVHIYSYIDTLNLYKHWLRAHYSRVTFRLAYSVGVDRISYISVCLGGRTRLAPSTALFALPYCVRMLCSRPIAQHCKWCSCLCRAHASPTPLTCHSNSHHSLVYEYSLRTREHSLCAPCPVGVFATCTPCSCLCTSFKYGSINGTCINVVLNLIISNISGHWLKIKKL